MNWIKVRGDLSDLTETDNLSDILGTDIPTTVGLLVLFWSYADVNTSDGTLEVSTSAIDRRTIKGFSDAMIEVGWLEQVGDCLNLPNFNRHNGSSAKARVLEAEAKRIRRASKAVDSKGEKCRTNVGQSSDALSDQIREDKIREELEAKASSIPPTPKGAKRDLRPTASELIASIPEDFEPAKREAAERFAKARQSYIPASKRFGTTGAFVMQCNRMKLYPVDVLVDAVDSAIAGEWMSWEQESIKSKQIGKTYVDNAFSEGRF